MKFSEAKNNGIETTFMSVTQFEGISDLDLCSLFGNMLDNAIAACIECPAGKRKIQMKISSECGDGNTEYFISLTNSVLKPVVASNPNLVTTNPNTEDHGHGVSIIRDISEKYGGTVEYFDLNRMFCFQVTFYVENKPK